MIGFFLLQSLFNFFLFLFTNIIGSFMILNYLFRLFILLYFFDIFQLFYLTFFVFYFFLLINKFSIFSFNLNLILRISFLLLRIWLNGFTFWSIMLLNFKNDFDFLFVFLKGLFKFQQELFSCLHKETISSIKFYAIWRYLS